MAKVRRVHSLAVVSGALCVVACGGGSALLHPAHVLPEGRISGGAGVTGQFAFGGARRAMDAQGATPTNAEQQFVEHAVAKAALAPGISPWVAARAGLGWQSEGGLTYTGRSARVDARRAFGDDTVAFSIGAGATAVLGHPGSHPPTSDPQPTIAGRFPGSPDDVSPTGWGLDVPAIVGWRSSASVVELWTGVRAGFERVGATLQVGSSTTALNGSGGLEIVGDEARLSGLRWYGSGLVGAAIGVRPVWIALELDGSYQSLSVGADFTGSGAPAHRDATLSGFTVSPAGAIIGKF